VAGRGDAVEFVDAHVGGVGLLDQAAEAFADALSPVVVTLP